MVSAWGAPSAAWRVLSGQGLDATAATFGDRQRRYAYLQSWETSEVFAPSANPALLNFGAVLKADLRLYRDTRLVYNPFPELTDFWGNAIYPGVLPGRKVYLRARTPDQVRAFVIDSAGDLDFYSLEYPVTESLLGGASRTYRYRMDVSKQEFATFRDGAPFDYSADGKVGARWRNPYGFVPACWVPHMTGTGGIGVPAIRAGLGELIELNSLQSAIDDKVYRATKPIDVFITNDPVELVVPQRKREGSAGRLSIGLPLDDSDRESHIGIRLSQGSSVSQIAPAGGTAEDAAYLAQRKLEWKQKYPELSMWESLRERDVSGIAAEILHGDTRNKVMTVRPQTDRQVVKATQMAISLAAFRYPAWPRPGAAQRAFAGFAPDAWERGDLDFEIAPRPLIPTPPLQQEESAQLADILINQLNVSPEYALTLANIPAKYIRQAVAQQQQAAARADALASNPPPLALPMPSGLPSTNGNGGSNG
jgi:hypothetical protein